MASKRNTPMQPYYIPGHTRPVRKVIHNQDGDLLFSCSDDGKVAMYDTFQCVRTGQFDVQSACTSIDVTKDSKYLLATSVEGIHIFNVKDGSTAATMTVPGNRKVQVSLAYGDRQFFLIYIDRKITCIRIYTLADVITSGSESTPKVVKEIQAAGNNEFSCAAWGPLNKTLYIGTKTGKLQIIDISSGTVIKDTQVHTSEVYELAMSHDFTMLFSASRDGTSKLLHLETFEEIRTYSFGGRPCRTVAVSPLFDSHQFQKFHMLMAGGQDAREVATTGEGAGGFSIRLFSVIFNQELAEIQGHFGPVNSVNFSPDGFAFASGGEDGYVHYHRFPPEYFTNDFE